MITLQRPGQQPLEIEYLLIDYEGTLASDGRIHPKAKDKINLLSKRVKIFILAKTEKEKVEETLRRVKAELFYTAEGDASKQKLTLLLNLGGPRTLVIGNGRDDLPIMQEAGLCLCVIGKEGAASEIIETADIVFINILDALDFLLKPLRQKATLSK
jgi:soluble P-type ATPase